MQAGRLVQEGAPRELYGGPASGFVADFVGDATFLPGEVTEGGIRAFGGRVRCSLPPGLAAGAKAPSTQLRREQPVWVELPVTDLPDG